MRVVESQSKDFEKVQQDLEEYLDRLQDNINRKAERFGHIEYYDALLRDGRFKDTAVAAEEVHELDDRRRDLIAVNPLFAKESEMPPAPNVESVTFEHMSLNLPVIARNALNDLDNISAPEEGDTETVTEE